MINRRRILAGAGITGASIAVAGIAGVVSKAMNTSDTEGYTPGMYVQLEPGQEVRGEKDGTEWKIINQGLSGGRQPELFMGSGVEARINGETHWHQQKEVTVEEGKVYGEEFPVPAYQAEVDGSEVALDFYGEKER